MATTQHDPEAERAILGAILLRGESVLSEVEALGVTSRVFHAPQHGIVFAGLQLLAARSAPLETLALCDELRAREQLRKLEGGEAFVASLLDSAPTGETVGYYARRVVFQATRRRVSRALREMAAEVEAHDDDEVFDRVEAALHEALSARTTDGSYMHVRELVREVVRELDDSRNGKVADDAAPTGLRALDNALAGGFREGKLVVIAARPGMGKSALALGCAEAAAKAGIPALVFSLEMSPRENAHRLVLAGAGVPTDNVRQRAVTGENWRAINARASELYTLPLYFDPRCVVSLPSLRSQVRRFIADRAHPAPRKLPGVVFVDYLQLLDGGSDKRQGREREVAEMSRGLKMLARDLSMPVVVLSQLSRSLESRADKRPVLSDLRESGAIEQDADAVVFVYRDEVYNAASDKRGEAELILAKNRSGPLTTVEVRWQAAQTRFVDASVGGWQ